MNDLIAVDEGHDAAISVIVITYNHEDYIRQALDSILSQEIDVPYEVIISEDCSTDSTLSIVREYIDKFPGPVRVLASETNLNNNEVVRRAIAAARGRYIAFLDGDDYWVSTNKLQAQFNHMEANPDCAIAFHDVARVTDDGELIRTESGYPKRQTIEDLIQGNFIATCTCMTRRSALSDLPGWLKDIRIGDWPTHLWAARSGFIDHVDGLLSHYRIHANAAWQTRPLVEQWTYTLSILMQLEAKFPSRYRKSFAKSRLNVVNHMLAALAESGRLSEEDITRFEAQRRIAAADERAGILEGRVDQLDRELADALRILNESETRFRESDQRVRDAESQAREAERHAREAEQQARDHELHARAAELNLRQLDIERKNAEQQVRNLEQQQRVMDDQLRIYREQIHNVERQVSGYEQKAYVADRARKRNERLLLVAYGAVFVLVVVIVNLWIILR